MTPLAYVTADELLYLNLPNKRTELVRGTLVVREPAGTAHGDCAARLLIAIGTFVQSHELGAVFAAETGFRLFTDPDTVRAPDVAFIRADRVPVPLPTGYFPNAPDLAVEVRSPGDSMNEIRDKVSDWLTAGTRLVWVVDPHARTAWVHRADASSTAIGVDGFLDGEGVLPEFSLELRAVFR